MLKLLEEPQSHADCCLSLSLPLLRSIRNYAQRASHGTNNPVLLLSIGAGTGLLEAYLRADFVQHGLDNIHVEAVEVQSAIVSYLPATSVHRVSGSWAISNKAHGARILLFCYPRDPHLVMRYVHAVGDHVQYILWFGPQTDWLEYQHISYLASVFETFTVLEYVGLASYELAAVFENKAYKDTNPTHGSHTPPSDAYDIDSI